MTLVEHREIEDWQTKQALVDSPENIARIQRNQDEVEPAQARERTGWEWSPLGFQLS